MFFSSFFFGKDILVEAPHQSETIRSSPRLASHCHGIHAAQYNDFAQQNFFDSISRTRNGWKCVLQAFAADSQQLFQHSSTVLLSTAWFKCNSTLIDFRKQGTRERNNFLASIMSAYYRFCICGTSICVLRPKMVIIIIHWSIKQIKTFYFIYLVHHRFGWSKNSLCNWRAKQHEERVTPSVTISLGHLPPKYLWRWI